MRCMSSTAAITDVSLYRYMIHSHQDLERSYCQLLEAMAVDAPEVRQIWNQLERGLLAHIEAEERFMLPAFARIDRQEAVALLREHALLRELLLELGVAVDLHLLRYDRSAELVEALRSHARREDKLLYQWASDHLDPEQVKAALAHASAR